MDRELLIEIGVEEIPAGWLPGLTTQLATRLESRLKELRLPAAAPVESFSTPRRLTARVGKLAERQADFEDVLTGPPVSAAFDAAGNPTPAAVGFARKNNVEVAALERLETGKGTYLTFRKQVRGKAAVDVLPDVLTGLLNGGAYGVRFAAARARATRYRKIFAVMSVDLEAGSGAASERGRAALRI